MATYKVHFTLEKTWYIEAESEEDLDQKLGDINWGSVEEKVGEDGADAIDCEIVGDTDRGPDYSLEADRDYDDMFNLVNATPGIYR